jgi:hypothetical protein
MNYDLYEMSSPYIFKSECVNVNIEDYKAALFTGFIITIVSSILSCLSCTGVSFLLVSDYSERKRLRQINTTPLSPP